MQDFREIFYNKYSSTFKEYLSDFSPSVIKQLYSNYKYQYLPIIKHLKRDAKILELGCGRGLLMEFFINQGYKNVKGIDVSEEQVKIAKEKKLKVTQASVFDYLKTDEESFDVIIAVDFLEHFTKAELVEICTGIYRKLNPGGLFIFHTPNGLGINANRMIYGDLTHIVILTPDSAKQLLRLVGFSQLKFYETGPYPKNFNGVIRTILWKFIKLVTNSIRIIETGGSEKILTQNFICSAKKSNDSNGS